AASRGGGRCPSLRQGISRWGPRATAVSWRSQTRRKCSWPTWIRSPRSRPTRGSGWGPCTTFRTVGHRVAVRSTSTKGRRRPGWVYVAYWPSPGKRFSDELVAVKLDGSGSVERYAHTHSDSNAGGYRAEPHGVPARDGRRILWASNWMLNATGGSASITQAY